jgi:thiamine-monophosphate kinase
MSESQRTELEEFGEFGLIDHLTSSFYINQKETKQGIGDDAAVCDPHGKQVILTTDMLVENVHFDLMYSPLKHLGYKSVVVNVSDVFAMNGVPKHILVSIGMSNRFLLRPWKSCIRVFKKHVITMVLTSLEEIHVPHQEG